MTTTTIKYITLYETPMNVVIGVGRDLVSRYCGDLLLDTPRSILVLPFVGVSRDTVTRIIGFKSRSMQLHVLGSTWTEKELELIKAVDANLSCCPNYQRIDVPALTE